MATYATYYQSAPLTIPGKAAVTPYYPVQTQAYAVSPPETAGSVTTGSGMANSYSAASSSYAGSASGEYDSNASANGIDLQEYMQDGLSNAFNPLPLDRTMVVQAQTSGLLNAKNREILDLQQIAQQRLAKLRARLPESFQDAKDVQRDLEWSSKRVSSMKSKASRKHPKEYKQARARYPSPEY